MKKLIAFLMVALLVVGMLAACGKNKASGSKDTGKNTSGEENYATDSVDGNGDVKEEANKDGKTDSNEATSATTADGNKTDNGNSAATNATTATTAPTEPNVDVGIEDDQKEDNEGNTEDSEENGENKEETEEDSETSDEDVPVIDFQDLLEAANKK